LPKYGCADTDDNGEPLVLTRLTNDSNKPSFAQLAEQASSDIRPRTQLQHLIERGLVEVDKDDNVHLLSQAYQPDGAQAELRSLMAEHLHDHIATVTGNLSPSQTKQLDRSAYHTHLSAESIQALQQYSEQLGMDMLKRVYARARELSNQDQQSTQDLYRFRVGIYAFHEEQTSVTEIEQKQAPK